MPTNRSLDELIAQKAVEFADQVRKAAAVADKEEEIRIAVVEQLAFIQKEAGVELHGKHEFTVAKGRVDSVYARVLIEYKNPGDAGARIGPKADSPGSKEGRRADQRPFPRLEGRAGPPAQLTLRRGAGRQRRLNGSGTIAWVDTPIPRCRQR